MCDEHLRRRDRTQRRLDVDAAVAWRVWTEPAGRFLEGVVSIVHRVEGADEPVTGVIRRLGEPVQFEPELLAQLRDAGVMPGGVATLSAAGGYVLVQVEGYGDGLELPHEVASHIYVGV